MRYEGRGAPVNPNFSKINPITGEDLVAGGGGGGRSQQIQPSASSFGRGKYTEDRFQQKEKEKKYKEELDKWVEQQKIAKARDQAADDIRRGLLSKAAANQQLQQLGSYEAYPQEQIGGGSPYYSAQQQSAANAGREDAEAYDRRNKRRELLEGYKSAIDAKKKTKDAEKERDKIYARLQYEEILKQDQQREDMFRKLKAGTMQVDRLQRSAQNQVSTQSNQQAYEDREAAESYEARQPVNRLAQLQQQQLAGQYATAGRDEENEGARYRGRAEEDYRGGRGDEELSGRGLAERNPADLNRLDEDPYQGVKYNKYVPEPVAVAPPRRNASQQPSNNVGLGNRSAAQDYHLIRQKYGMHAGGYNIISHQ